MPVNYNGVAANFDPNAQFAVSQPADLESITAASEGAEHQKEADAIEFNRVHSPWKDLLSTISAVWTWTIGRIFSATPVTWALTDYYTCGDAYKVRHYAANGYAAWTYNAKFDDGGTNKWSSDDNAQPSWIHYDGGSVSTHDSTAGTWTDAQWDPQILFNPGGAIIYKTLTLNGAAGLSVGTAGIASGGEIDGTKLKATAGNVEAQGTPVGNAGPGLVKASRIYSTGGAVVAGDFGTFTNFLGAGSSTSVQAGSTDMAGSITIVAGAGAGNPGSFKFTFHDGTFTNTPQIKWMMSGGANADMSAVSWSTTATSSTVTYPKAVTNGNTYTFDWIMVGV